jgi:hypothetical protein
MNKPFPLPRAPSHFSPFPIIIFEVRRVAHIEESYTVETMTTERPPRILTLDGGGVRGLSVVLILKHLMMRLKQSEQERTSPTTLYALGGN